MAITCLCASGLPARDMERFEPEQGSEPTRVTLALLQDTAIWEFNITDLDELSWVEGASKQVEAAFDPLGLNQKVYVVCHAPVDGELSWRIEPADAVPEATAKPLLEYLREHSSLSPVAVDAYFALAYVPRGGDLGQVPDHLFPGYHEARRYMAASLPEKRELLMAKAQDYWLPLFGHAASNVDPQFEGVRAMGSLLLDQDRVDSESVHALTFANVHFWRGTMEMAPGNPLVDGMPVLLYVSHGELSKAENILRMLNYTMDAEVFFTRELYALIEQLQLINEDMNPRVQRGIELYDAGKPDEALAVLKPLVEEYPYAVWPWHEYYMTMVAKDAANSSVYFEAFRQKREELNPLYTSPFGSLRTGKEAYEMSLRMQLGELFQDSAKAREDYITYAEHVMDLEEYGFAAMLYWKVYGMIDQSEEYLRRYLYCTQKAGAEDVDQFFQDELSENLDVIDEARLERMRQSTFYQSMKVPE